MLGALNCLPLLAPAPTPTPHLLQFNQLVPNAWRVVNKNDAVTLVPRMLGYW